MATIIGSLELAILLASLLMGLYFRNRVIGASRPPLPPGPKGYPIIGNVLTIPTQSAWICYTELAKQYGKQVLFDHCFHPVNVGH